MTKSPTKATVLMSGGIDSAACAYHLRSQGLAVDGLFIDYGQAAADQEAKAVMAIANHLGITIRPISIEGSQDCGPGEHLGRNAFLIFAALFLTRGQSSLLGIGLHSGTPYYDCSENFVVAITKLIAEHTNGQVSVMAPFKSWTKRDIFEYFVLAGLRTEFTYSCEAGTIPTCGICASCRDRRALGC